MPASPSPLPYRVLGPAEPTHPVLLSVPHAGRAYPAELLAAARVPASVLDLLEDRLVDELVAEAAARGATGIAATVPRAMIDLNRAIGEIDPAMVTPPPRREGLVASARVRGGLGLIPRAIGAHGALWRGPISAAELARRVGTMHAPYHSELARRMRALRDAFGWAVLLDCHSMPTISGAMRTDMVIGDRYGSTAEAALVAALIAALERAGFTVARNSPYAGGHIIERHGTPSAGLHAIQLEIDRSLYLDRHGRDPGPGFARVASAIADAVAALARAAPQAGQIAAE